MSTIFRKSKKCAVCQAKSEQTVIGSTNSFGYSDLDLRPPEMRRSTMCYWPEKCPACGYVAYDIERETTIQKDWLASEQYVHCEGHHFASSLAAEFYQIYLTAKETGNCQDAFNASLNAAWASDDCCDTENAALCRILAIPFLMEEISQNPQMAETLTIVLADVLRRAGKFDQLIEQYTDMVFSEDILNQICQFQLEKAKQKDTACYRVSDVIPGEE